VATAEQLAQFRIEFREQYGLDGDFLEAFARWGQAGGPERISSFSESDILDVLGHIQRNAGTDEAQIIEDAIGNRPLDPEQIAVQKALTAVLEAIDASLNILGPQLAPRAMRTNPDPAAALLIARDVIGRVPIERRPRKAGRATKKLRNRVVEIMAAAGYPPAKITDFLLTVGYSESESSPNNIAATIHKLERAGKQIPISPTARNRTRGKHRKSP
jgi:hypothetical protein